MQKLTIAGLIFLTGCAGTGPSKARYRVLLSECRIANRERVRIIKEYDAKPMFELEKCAHIQSVPYGWICGPDALINRPEQGFNTINFGEAGH